jgi:hypothetical protein
MTAWKDHITQAFAAIQARSSVQPAIAPGAAAGPAPSRNSASLASASFHERRVQINSVDFLINI